MKFLKFSISINNYIRNLNRDEKGIATVLTIGILALMAALAIGFVSESILLEKISKNSLNLERARLLSQAMVQRTIAAADYHSKTSSSTLFKFYSTEETAIPDTDTLDTAISTTFNNIAYYDWDKDDPDSPRWQYIRTIRNSEGDSQIIGRIAYVVINNIGKLDPSVIIDTAGNASVDTPAVAESSTTYTSVNSAESYVTGRPGVDINEIFAVNLDGSIMTNTVLNTMSAGNSNSLAELDTETRWFDIADFIGTVDNSADETDRTKFNNWFTTDNPADPEAFWIDIDGDDIIDSQYEQFHRFNLTRNDWDSLSVSDLTGANTVLFTTAYGNTSVKCIPWLKNWKDAGEMGSVTKCQNQIIANLIDYCDSDDTPHTDYPVETPPTYVGLEKVPYINELYIKIRGTAQWQHLTGSNYRFRTIFDILEIKLETINIYNCNKSVTGKLNLSFNFDFVNLSELETTPAVAEKTFSISHSGTGYEVTQPDGFSTETVYYPNSTDWENFSAVAIGHFGIDNFKINATISLEDSAGNLLDYSSFSTTPVTNFTRNNTSNDDGSEADIYYFYSQTSDPRQNLNSSDWTSEYSEADDIGTLSNPYTNDNANPSSSGSDPETATDPVNISTAYIRNAPMQSPWELGFIHRGKKWQTINLKAYNSTEGAATDAGGNAYSDGDANILDQIKMTSNTETYGKVNINSINADASNYTTKKAAIADIFTSLFKDIYVNIGKSNYDNPGTQTGDQITSTIAEYIADSLYAVGPTVFQTRAQIVRPTNGVSKLYNGTEITQDNDAAQEEIIGKMINLTTAANSNNITLIAVAQIIKDIGPNIAMTKNNVTKMLRYNEYVPGYDPILAEQKILIVLIRNPVTFKWQIKKLRYLNL